MTRQQAHFKMVDELGLYVTQLRHWSILSMSDAVKEFPPQTGDGPAYTALNDHQRYVLLDLVAFLRRNRRAISQGLFADLDHFLGVLEKESKSDWSSICPGDIWCNKSCLYLAAADYLAEAMRRAGC